MKSIKVLKDCVVNAKLTAKAGKTYTVGKEVTDKEAKDLVAIGRAEEVKKADK